MFGHQKNNRNMEELEHKLGHMQKNVNEKYARFMKELQWNREKMRWFVRYNPERAMLMSFSAGIVAGVFIFSVLRRRRN